MMRVLQQQQSSSGNEEEGLFEKWTIQDATWGIPFLYLTIILSIPKGKSILFLMIISFVTGLTIDLFEGQLGLHSTSCIIIAFLRPKILSILSNSNENVLSIVICYQLLLNFIKFN